MIRILIAFGIVFGTIFGFLFGAFWGQTSALNSIRKAYQLRFVFRLDFGPLLASSWVPSWPHFRLQGGGPVRRYPLLCCVGVFFRFFRPPVRWGTPFWAARSDGVPHFWLIFGANLVPTWRHLAPLWCKRWSWMGWVIWCQLGVILRHRHAFELTHHLFTTKVGPSTA